MTKEKKWYQSKTKISSVIIGVSAILGTVGGFMTGSISSIAAVQSLMIEIGAILFVFGIRDLPFVNKK